MELNSHYRMVGDIVESKKEIARSEFLKRIRLEALELGLDFSSLMGVKQTGKVKNPPPEEGALV